MSRNIEEIKFSSEGLRAYKNMSYKLTGKDIILLLLLISPTRGKTKLQKQVFLTWKTIFNKNSNDLGFFPYKFGAYSKAIEDAIEILEKTNLIEIKKDRDEAQRYFITMEGKKEIINKIKDFKINLNKLSEKKIDWDEWSTKGIMRYVYRNFPEYTTETKVPSLKW